MTSPSQQEALRQCLLTADRCRCSIVLFRLRCQHHSETFGSSWLSWFGRCCVGGDTTGRHPHSQAVVRGREELRSVALSWGKAKQEWSAESVTQWPTISVAVCHSGEVGIRWYEGLHWHREEQCVCRSTLSMRHGHVKSKTLNYEKNSCLTIVWMAIFFPLNTGSLIFCPFFCEPQLVRSFNHCNVTLSKQRY